jgi:superfamily II DNA or RNA helicase
MLSLTESAVYVYVAGDRRELNLLVDALKYRPDQYFRADSYQVYVATSGKSGWDGYLRPLSVGKDGKGRALRGLADRLIAQCDALTIPVNKDKLLTQPFKHLTVGDIPANIISSGFALDDDQLNGILTWLNHGIGVCHVTVSGGKTGMFLAAAAIVRKQYPNARILYVTPTERLVNQVMKTAREFLPDWHVTQFGGGTRDFTGKHMVVATTASIWKNFKELKDTGWLKSFSCLCFDESHTASSTSATAVIKATPAFFKFGASDTVCADDKVRSTLIEGLLGPVRYHITAAPLISIGRIAKPHIYLVDRQNWTGKYATLGHTAQPDSAAWVLLDGVWKKGVYIGPAPDRDEKGDEVVDDDGKVVPLQGFHRILVDGEEHSVNARWSLLDRLYDKGIIQFKERNELIAQWACHYSRLGFPTLIVCTRTLHVLILQAVVQALLGDENKVRILFSDHTTKQRNETFEWFKSTPGSVLITPLVKIGVSINEIRAGIIADHVVSWEVANQLLGRVVRKKSGTNEAHVVFFVDRQHPRLRSNSLELLRSLGKIKGYTFYWPCNTPETAVENPHFF